MKRVSVVVKVDKHFVACSLQTDFLWAACFFMILGKDKSDSVNCFFHWLICLFMLLHKAALSVGTYQQQNNASYFAFMKPFHPVINHQI